MLSLQNVSKTYGDKLILDTIDLTIAGNEVVSLIGDNGSGKTTLMRILVGDLKPDSGSMQRDNLHIGYLPQEPNFGDATIHDYLESKLPEENQAYRINQSLEQVGLSSIDQLLPATDLSGGQKTKLGLAALLLTNPGVLLLDEPTNNLDIEGLDWLKWFIASFKGSVLIISHDRAFLDEVVDRIIELKDGKLKNYGGNYSFYAAVKLAEKQAELARYEQNQEEIKRLEKAIADRKERAQQIAKDTKLRRDNDRYAVHFFAQRASKKINRNANALESRLDQFERIDSPHERKVYPKQFLGETHEHKLVIAGQHIIKSFDNKTVLADISLEIVGSEHVWLAGPNGSGKSTLLSILAKESEPDMGEVKWGAGVRVGYFSQDLSGINLQDTGLAALLKTEAKQEDCFKQAKSLGLRPQELQKPIRELSRGQIVKLAFAKLLLEQNHLLILDEPTNHLEIATREEIETALTEYRGAILVASHDRYFLESIGIDREITF
jgi:macrolide transport system ATP-binding/permease protein